LLASFLVLQNAISFDQAKLASALISTDTEGFALAKAMYEQGGFSKSYAEVILSTGLSAAVPAGTAITGTAIDGNTVSGTAYESYEAASTSIKILYHILSEQAVRPLKSKSVAPYHVRPLSLTPLPLLAEIRQLSSWWKRR
jgi:hypothetical protein